jgi:hypothetical protein
MKVPHFRLMIATPTSDAGMMKCLIPVPVLALAQAPAVVSELGRILNRAGGDGNRPNSRMQIWILAHRLECNSRGDHILRGNPGYLLRRYPSKCTQWQCRCTSSWAHTGYQTDLHTGQFRLRLVREQRLGGDYSSCEMYSRLFRPLVFERL